MNWIQINKWLWVVASIKISLVILLPLLPAYGTLQVLHQAPPFVESNRSSTFEFRIPGLNSDQVRDAYIHYRYQGENAYRQQRTSISDSRIVADLHLSDRTGTTAEYYLSIEYLDGSSYSWPDPSAPAGPATVEIIAESSLSKKVFDNQTGEILYSILSPEPGERIRSGDFFLGVTLFYEYEEAEPDSFRVHLNGEDITAHSEISTYLITYVPSEPLREGSYQIELSYHSPEGMIVDVGDWNFQIIPRIADDAVSAAPARRRVSAFYSSGQYQATARSQSYSEQTTQLFRNNLRISGEQGSLRYQLAGQLTTQEDPRLQTQNTFSARVQAGNWMLLEAGHIYPALSSYLIAGQRMYGIHSELRMLSEHLQLQFLYGSLYRSISPLYRDLFRQERVLGQDAQGQDITDISYLLQSEQRGSGTYSRDIMGARMGFGSGRPFGMSLHALRVEDAMSSIPVIRSYDDLGPDMIARLSPAERMELINDPNLLEIRTSDPLPQANIALAADMEVRVHNERILLRSDVASSLVNHDISQGILDKARADDLGFDLDDNVASLLDQLSWLIIINENMNALPLKIKDEEADIFVPMGIFATQSRLNMNYFNHQLAIQYQWVGPDFQSLANTGQRRDISGFSVSDRFRVLSNTIYLTLAHENLKDNVIGNREATTHSVANRINLGWYPASIRLPRISAGVRRRTRDNGVNRINPFLPAELAGASVRNVEIAGDSLNVLPSPRNNVTMQYNVSLTQRFSLFDLNHDAGINYTYMNTEDRVFQFGDFTSNVLSLELTSSFPAMPLRTNLGFNINKTESSSGLSELTVWGFNTGISWYFLEDRFHLTTDLAMTFDRSESTPLTDVLYQPFSGQPSQEVFWRYYTPDTTSMKEEQTVSFLFKGGLRYRIHARHALHLTANYTHLSDRYASLNIPNHHLAQIRYVFDF